MASSPNATAAKFGYPDSLLRAYRHWLALVRPQQATLGALVLVCTDPATAFSQISVRAFEELAQVTADLDAALARAFAPIWRRCSKAISAPRGSFPHPRH